MVRFLIRRFLQALLVIWGVSTLVFGLLHLSGDPTLLMVPPGAPAEAITLLRHQLGFDQPLWVQYGKFLWGLVQGDMGMSLVQNRPAFSIVMERVPATLQLGGASMLIAIVIGIPIGIASALYRGSLLDRVGMFVALLGQAMPPFWLGLVLILFLSVRHRIFPPSGAETWLHLVLPAFTLGVLSLATFARMTRSAYLEEARRDYVRTAKAKGAGRFRVIFGHLMRNAAIPIITVAALSVGNLLGGAVVTETIFAWPGIGRLMIDSIAARDYPLVQAVVLVGSGLFVMASITADLLYSLVDPRIQLE
jgi:peptide/nickel transport system permease protein